MSKTLTREEAWELLKEYNKEPFHLQHGETVEGVMRYFAKELGYGDDAEFWAVVGLLHDLDFEKYPEEHCIKCQEIMKALDLDEKLIHAVASHGYGICCDVEPVHEMEKVLFATDELTGLIGAAALMRPSKSVQDMELKSLKKKFKDKSFAAGCDRDTIRRGAEQLGWELDTLLEKTLAAMKTFYQ
ncbi:hydrolase [Anaerotignum lactatifermentans]|uniref:Hydrolase n=1 Tax=Anaerotignum lactatifermentans TaxID=160404 RepID=A0ABS2GB79_9FIRM|nr:hydrolase [Anaerotignum lactatifermentans]MBM6828450.1 hydrolase [Anaerotignum lactatifermentans]MBM6877857.1 hydrolase [Anaerotignum lactatifermentans]MBM6950033.1 hydrolase [Anaerotignum lactatifermentans]